MQVLVASNWYVVRYPIGRGRCHPVWESGHRTYYVEVWWTFTQKRKVFRWKYQPKPLRWERHL